MAGHSKWAQTKHKKALIDARRGKLFTKLIRAIEVAARDGGGNPDANPTLSDAIGRARDSSMPNETIERAIKRGTGELGGTTYETLTYEGYGPSGVAVMVEVLTDNRNRAATEIRRIFSGGGGSLGEPGSVSWMFTKQGVLLVPKAAASEDDLLGIGLDAGAEEIKEEGDSWQISCSPEDLKRLRDAIEAAGLAVESAQISMEAKSIVPLDVSAARQVLKLIDELEESDEVQEVYSNFDVPDEVLAEVAG
jgi:YebC/PmpR family DNA-binding regulatory protein